MSRPIYRRKGAQPASVADFLARTHPKDARFAGEMGPIAPEHAQNFQALCQHFAEGVQYVSDRYGSAPRAIAFEDQLDEPEGNLAHPLDLPEEGVVTPAVYDPACQAIFLNRAWFNLMLSEPDEAYFVDERDERHPITREQHTFLLGVEEAYHHKQKFGGSRAQRKGFSTVDYKMDDAAAHWDDPHENEARHVLLEVARELGIIKTRRRNGR